MWWICFICADLDDNDNDYEQDAEEENDDDIDEEVDEEEGKLFLKNLTLQLWHNKKIILAEETSARGTKRKHEGDEDDNDG